MTSNSNNHEISCKLREYLHSKVQEDMLEYLICGVVEVIQDDCSTSESLEEAISDLIFDTNLFSNQEAQLFINFILNLLTQKGESDVATDATMVEDVKDPTNEEESFIGKMCLAVLAEDGDWHEAIVDDIRHDPVSKSRSYTVRFLEFDKTELISNDNRIVFLDQVVDEELRLGKNYACQMCNREVKLTRHHLIPRVEHSRYIRLFGYSREELNRCINICRPCHSFIHSQEVERVLAKDYNTLEKLMEHSEIKRYVEYARKQKVKIKI